MGIFIIGILLWAAPNAALIWFAVSVIRFFSAPRGSELRRKRRLPLIISSLIIGFLLLLSVSLFVLDAMAIAYM